MNINQCYEYNINKLEEFTLLMSNYGVTVSEFVDTCADMYDDDFVKNRRCKDNWSSSNCLYADIDDGFSIVLFKYKFRKYEYYLHTSSSHTAELNKYHVFFPITQTTDIEYYKELQWKLTKIKCKESDQSGVDITKYLTPNFNKIETYYNEGVSIEEDLNEIIIKKKKIISVKIESFEGDEIIVDLKKLADVDDFLETSDWFKLGVSLKNAGFDLIDWNHLSWDSVDEDVMKNCWDRFNSSEFLNKSWLINRVNRRK